MRPDNLDPERLPSSRAVIARQCVEFRGATSNISAQVVSELFALEAWSRDASRLLLVVDEELDAIAGEHETRPSVLGYYFALSIAVVRHLQLDPLLPQLCCPQIGRHPRSVPRTAASTAR